MRNAFNQNNQISSSTAARAIVPFAVHTQLHAFSYTAWNADTGLNLLRNQSLLIGVFGLAFDHLAHSRTNRTRAVCCHLTQKSILNPANSSRPITLFTCSILHALGLNHPAVFHRFLHARFHLRQCESYFDSDVGTNRPPRTTATTTKERTKHTVITAKHIPKLREYIVHAKTVCTTTAASTHARMTKLIVALLFVWITQYIISLCRLLKHLLRLLITLIFIGVILDRQLSICLLNFLRRSSAGNT